MNKKLKETLKHLFATQKINNGWTSFSEKECKELSNYITNLQEENEELKEETYKLTELWKNEVDKRRKAIEYIDSLWLDKDGLVLNIRERLHFILRGKDNE